MPRRLATFLIAASLMLAAASSAYAAPPAEPRPGQRTDLKVLLVGRTDTEPTFGAWEAELRREGVPFDSVLANPTPVSNAISDAKLADYTGDHAYYQAVILSNGDVLNPFPDALAALAKFERSFGVRQVSDNTWPWAAHGLNAPIASGAQDGITANLTPAGRLVFPYLNGRSDRSGHMGLPGDAGRPAELHHAAQRSWRLLLSRGLYPS